MSSLPRKPYRIPNALRDLQLVDFLELTGSTTASAEQIGLSQPSVSRRYRALAADLGLQHRPDDPIGRRYGHTPWLQLLRQGIRSHRLSWGVLRIGGVDEEAMGLKGRYDVEWVTLGRRSWVNWQVLLQLELLDAVALQEPPVDQASAMISYQLLHRPNGWLACRPEPQVLGLATRLCEP